MKFKLDKKGTLELLKSEEMAEVLKEVAQEYCPEGCTVNTHIGKTRANASIVAERPNRNTICPVCGHWHPNCTHIKDMVQDTLENNTLLKAIGGG